MSDSTSDRRFIGRYFPTVCDRASRVFDSVHDKQGSLQFVPNAGTASRIVFLDLDGVVNQNQHPLNREGSLEPVVDTHCLNLLLQLLRDVDGSIVLHSGWRDSLDPSWFLRLAPRIPFPVHRLEGWCRPSAPKAEVIREWLFAFGAGRRYVVIDDEWIDAVTFVQTNGHVGLTHADVERAQALLLA